MNEYEKNRNRRRRRNYDPSRKQGYMNPFNQEYGGGYNSRQRYQAGPDYYDAEENFTPGFTPGTLYHTEMYEDRPYTDLYDINYEQDEDMLNRRGVDDYERSGINRRYLDTEYRRKTGRRGYESDPDEEKFSRRGYYPAKRSPYNEDNW